MSHPEYVQELIAEAYKDAEAAGELEPAHLQYRRLRERTDLLAETVRDIAVLVERHMRNTGNEQTARQVMVLIEWLDPDPGYAEGQEPFGVPA